MSVFKIWNMYSSSKKLMGRSQTVSTARRYWDDAAQLNKMIDAENDKPVRRTDIINHCAEARGAASYLEIGVRNPADNYDHVRIKSKTSVDPGVEFAPNPVDFPMTSDRFFEHWKKEIGTPYDVIFVDGLHRADQVARDIDHAMEMVSEAGVILLHDCNPLHPELARETFDRDGVAQGYWNGTTWKAAWAFFFTGTRELRVVDTDWGVGMIDMSKPQDPRELENPFFEFDAFEARKREAGYLVGWDEAKRWLAS